jgi:hypothetical protein
VDIAYLSSEASWWHFLIDLSPRSVVKETPEVTSPAPAVSNHEKTPVWP